VPYDIRERRNVPYQERILMTRDDVLSDARDTAMRKIRDGGSLEVAFREFQAIVIDLHTGADPYEVYNRMQDGEYGVAVKPGAEALRKRLAAALDAGRSQRMGNDPTVSGIVRKMYPEE
jgi:hypothetical protein